MVDNDNVVDLNEEIKRIGQDTYYNLQKDIALTVLAAKPYTPKKQIETLKMQLDTLYEIGQILCKGS